MGYIVKHLTASELDQYKRNLRNDFYGGKKLFPYADLWDIVVKPERRWSIIHPDQNVTELAYIESFFRGDAESAQFEGDCILASAAVYGREGYSKNSTATKHTSGIVCIERLGQRNIKFARNQWPREDETFCVHTCDGGKYYVQASRRNQGDAHVDC